MLILPPEIMTILLPFTQVFSARVWDWAQILLVGAILAPGKRTVTAALRVLGLKDEKQSTGCSTGPSGPAFKPAGFFWGCW